MSAGFIGYDPMRVLQLRSRVVAAIDRIIASDALLTWLSGLGATRATPYITPAGSRPSMS